MSRLLPERHPNKDFFVLDVKDASPKDDMASMEHPFYSLSVKPDMRELEYNHNGNRINIVPSGRGLATIMDKDILLYVISKLTHAVNREEDINPWVDLTAHEVMVGTNWNTGKRDYQRFEDALVRLRGTTIVTNIKTGGQRDIKGFGLIEEFEITRIDDEGEEGPFGRMSKVRVKVSEHLLRSIKARQVLSINPLYFRLRRPIERRLYELVRKHVGDQAKWQIGLAKLQKKVGSGGPIKKFRFVMKQVIQDGNIPDYSFSIEDDMVTVKPLIEKERIFADTLVKLGTLDKAREMAAERGYDFQALLREWESLIATRGQPEHPDGALIGFIKAKPPLRRQAQLL